MDTSTLSVSDYISFIPFNAADLAANRQGHLTERQRERMQDMHALHKRWLKGGTLIMLLLWYSVNLLFALFSTSYRQDLSNAEGLMSVFGMPTLLWILGYLFGRLMNTRFVNQTRTLSAVGKAHKKMFYVYGKGYIVSVNKVRFYCSEEFFNCIEEDQNYALYYIRNMGNKMIVSWEKIQNTNL